MIDDHGVTISVVCVVSARVGQTTLRIRNEHLDELQTVSRAGFGFQGDSHRRADRCQHTDPQSQQRWLAKT